ncbi:MAG: hypothetical protein FWH32_00540 [Clostridiales bacterium]|nr:hypothetical protein [Clostridiales bacterium]
MAKLTHAILIEGGSEAERSGKAAALLKEHFADDPEAAARLDIENAFEDLIIVEPEEGKDILVSQIEELTGLFKQKPFASTGRACIVPQGERMNEHAQNKLLKLLEEPALGGLVLILTANAERLLPTVRSRCMRIWLGHPKPEAAPVTEDLRRLTAVLIYGKGTIAEAWQIFLRYEALREEAVAFLLNFQLFLRSLSVGRAAPELVGDDLDEGKWLRESASKVQQKHAERMRNGVLQIEKALESIVRGDRVRYALRGMALSMYEGAV